MQNETKIHAHAKMEPTRESKTLFNPLLEQLYEPDVVCLKPSNSLYEAAKEMLDNHVGNVLIVDEYSEKNIPVGIITDRDIVINSLAKKVDPASIELSTIMTKKIVTAPEDADLSTLVKILTEQGIGRIPIVNAAGELKGILSSKRLFQFFAQGLCELSSLSVEQQRREGKTH